MNTIVIHFNRCLLILICIISVIVINTNNVFADTYDVTAVVPFDPPTIPATVTSPANNTTVNTSNIEINGTCQELNPAVIVSVWNGPLLLGSTTCLVGGNYSINVAMFSGTNVLIIKSSNVNGLYGPDSTPFNINYTPNQPVSNPSPSQDSGNNNNNFPPGPANNPQNSGELLLTSLAPFGVTNSENTVSITVRISGGNNPYSLTINWGDGTTMTQKLDTEGDYTFSHTYETADNYIVNAIVVDVLGNSRKFNWAVSPGTQSIITDNQAVIEKSENKSNLNSYLFALIILILLFLIYISFLVGRYYQNKKDMKTMTKPANKKKR